jgi:predicted PurR-regulated permease PerM
MKFSAEARSTTLEDKAFLLLLVAVSVAFLWVLWPFFGALFWGAVFALMFSPLHFRFFKAMPTKRTAAALLTLAVILVLVILPVTVITTLLVKQAAAVYQQVQSGELSFSGYFQQIFDALPVWLTGLLERFGMNDLSVIQQQLAAVLKRGSQFFATQALAIGQNTFDFLVSFFVMMYVLFFLLRDGGSLSRRIEEAVPLEPAIKRNLSGKFTTVIRATVRGNLVVAVVQGAIGGFMFWLLGIHASILWGTLMALLSLLPAGAAVVWAPVAVYFLVTGAAWKGVVLIVVGAVGIGLVDNFLRPLLVGKDTKMPDYVVLVSTLGGMALFGLSGFVIGPVVAAMFMAVWDIFAKARLAEPASTPMRDGP